MRLLAFLILSLPLAAWGSEVSNVTVALHRGWNAVGFQCQELTDLAPNPAVIGSARWTGSGYTSGPFALPELKEAGAVFLYADADTSFTYSGRDVHGPFLDLKVGYQLVSFGIVVIPTPPNVLIYEAGSNAPAGDVLQPGQAYWVYSNEPRRLTWGPSPTLTLTPQDATVALFQTIQFSVTDEFHRDVTGQATWASRDPSVAAVVGPGLYKGLNAFPTRIVASLGGTTVETGLTVVNPGVPGPTPPAPGGRLYVANTNTRTITSYTGLATLDGDRPPTTIVPTPSPRVITGDAGRRLLYVGGTELRLYREERVVATLTGFDRIRSLAVDVSRDRLYVGDATGGGRVALFENASQLASGVAAPSRTLTGLGGDLVYGLAVDAERDRLFVGVNNANRILVYDQISTNSVANRTVTGVTQVASLALDPSGQRLYAGTALTQLFVFNNAATMAGAAAPAATMTGLSSPLATFLDPGRDELYVASFNAVTPRVAVFAGASGLSGAVAPVPSRVLAGASTMLNTPFGMWIDFTRN